ncbi:MAG: HDOD domain-containing protein [Planctomycetes bacterium]|nr:HDOD domain-containing protein [Planctomycetota bacterium]MCC7399143.1 HDOD domain-containing protein [Planctomycetota bacterium]
MNHSTLSHLALQEKTRREILHKSDLIPPLPDLVVRLLALLNKQETEPQDLETLLQNDQVLVAKMLAMVNSPFYGLNRAVRTVREAVMVLGFRGVRSLVLAASTAKFLQRDYACYGHEPKGLWLHSVAVAAGARALARRCRMDANQSEMLFVAGLMHDIGKLLLVSYLNESGQKPPAGKPSFLFERATVGLDHAEVGALVTAKWNLAVEIQEVIKAHHEINQDSSATMKDIAVVRLIDAVAHERGTGYRPGAAPKDVVQPGDLAALGIAPEAWTTVRDELVVTMDDAVAAMATLSS